MLLWAYTILKILKQCMAKKNKERDLELKLMITNCIKFFELITTEKNVIIIILFCSNC